MAWVVKRAKLNFKKVFFWNTLICNVKSVGIAQPFVLPGKDALRVLDALYATPCLSLDGCFSASLSPFLII